MKIRQLVQLLLVPILAVLQLSCSSSVQKFSSTATRINTSPSPSPTHSAKGESHLKKDDHVAGEAKGETPSNKDDFVTVQVHYGTNRKISNASPSILTQIWDFCWLGLILGVVWGVWTIWRRMRQKPVGIGKFVGLAALLMLVYGGYSFWIETAKPHPGVIYGSERDAQLNYGIAEVTIPKNHKEAEIESPQLFKLEFRWDPAKHNILRKTQPLRQNEFYQGLRAVVSQHPRKSVLLFVHGYNTPFAEACRRGAQLALDMRMPGVPMLFSWPSFGEGEDYPADTNMAQNSEDALVTFLTELRKESGADQIWILAHSMGNQVVTRALRQLEIKGSGLMVEGYVALAADVDRQAFSDDVPRYKKIAKHLALYCSSQDRALKASKQLYALPRAGDSNPTPLVVSGLETFDASVVDTDFLGHSYYGSVKVVVDDIGELLRGTLPSKRTWLELKQGFWEFLPPH